MNWSLSRRQQQREQLKRQSLSDSIMQKILSSKHITKKETSSSSSSSTVIILDWTRLDTTIRTMDTLRDKVSFIIHEYYQYYKDHQKNDHPIGDNDNDNDNNINNPLLLFEVIILLESPGGSASDYALAASQIIRMKQYGITVTICVDKIAASGMYMYISQRQNEVHCVVFLFVPHGDVSITFPPF
jgi:hypothetical protein